MLLNLIALCLGAIIAVVFALLPLWGQWLVIGLAWGFIAWRAYA
jgi:hypothetical protein